VEFLVNSYTTGSQTASAIAAAGSTFVVVFSGETPPDHDGGIGAQRYDATAGPLGGELAINSYTSGGQGTPSVSIDTHGSFLVTWASAGLDDDLGGVSAQRFSNAGVPRGSEFRVNSVTASAQKRPRTAVDAGGTFVVVWDSQAAGSYDVVARTMKNGGALQGDDVAVNAFTTGIQTSAKVAAGPTGNFVVVWESNNQESATSGVDLYARLLRPSGDVDGNGVLNVNDVFYLINFLFAGGPPPLGPANPDGLGSTDVADVFYLINFLFAGGPAPV